MGLLKRDTERAEIPFERIAALREYVNRQLDLYRKGRQEDAAKREERVQYSFREPAYDENGIMDMGRFLDDARKDNALFGNPAMQKTYRRWEKETAAYRTFSSEILRMLEERKIRPADFYREAQIDKRVFHTMKKDYLYKPSKDTAFRCCAGLKLTYEETAGLLELAGYSLSPGDSRELVLRFCLENRIYDIYSINCMLNAMGEKELR